MSPIEPNSFAGYFRQRKRIFLGHLALRAEHGIRSPSMGIGLALRAWLRAVRAKPRDLPLFLLAALLETAVRLSAYLTFRFRGVKSYSLDKVA